MVAVGTVSSRGHFSLFWLLGAVAHGQARAPRSRASRRGVRRYIRPRRTLTRDDANQSARYALRRRPDAAAVAQPRARSAWKARPENRFDLKTWPNDQ